MRHPHRGVRPGPRRGRPRVVRPHAGRRACHRRPDQQRRDVLLPRHPPNPRGAHRTHHPAARPDQHAAMPPLCRRNGPPRTRRAHPQHVLLLAVDALPGTGPVQRLESLSARLLRGFCQRGPRTGNPRHGRIAGRRGHRSLRVDPLLAADRIASGRADLRRPLRPKRVAGPLARPPLDRPRLVEPCVDTPLQDPADVRI